MAVLVHARLNQSVAVRVFFVHHFRLSLLTLCRAVFKYENDGQGKLIEAGDKGEEYDEFLQLLGGEFCGYTYTCLFSILAYWGICGWSVFRCSLIFLQ